MIQILWITTLSAIVIGVIVYLVCNDRPIKSRTETLIEPECKRVPGWMQLENMKIPIQKGDYVLNLSAKNPHADYGELGLVTKRAGLYAWVGWNFQDKEIPTCVSHLIKAEQATKKLKQLDTIVRTNNEGKPPKIKGLIKGCIVKAPYMVGQQHSGYVEGKFIGYSPTGLYLVTPHNSSYEVHCYRIDQIIKSPNKKPKK